MVIPLIVVVIIGIAAISFTLSRPAETPLPPEDSMGIYVEMRGSCSYGFEWVGNDLRACFERDSFDLPSWPDRMHVTAFQAGFFLVEGETDDCVQGIPVGIPVCTVSLSSTRYSCDSEVKVIVVAYDGAYPSPVRDFETWPDCQ